jgi:hypothetical protein
MPASFLDTHKNGGEGAFSHERLDSLDTHRSSKKSVRPEGVAAVPKRRQVLILDILHNSAFDTPEALLGDDGQGHLVFT